MFLICLYGDICHDFGKGENRLTNALKNRDMSLADFNNDYLQKLLFYIGTKITTIYNKNPTYPKYINKDHLNKNIVNYIIINKIKECTIINEDTLVKIFNYTPSKTQTSVNIATKPFLTKEQVADEFDKEMPLDLLKNVSHGKFISPEQPISCLLSNTLDGLKSCGEIKKYADDRKQTGEGKFCPEGKLQYIIKNKNFFYMNLNYNYPLEYINFEIGCDLNGKDSFKPITVKIPFKNGGLSLANVIERLDVSKEPNACLGLLFKTAGDLLQVLDANSWGIPYMTG